MFYSFYLPAEQMFLVHSFLSLFFLQRQCQNLNIHTEPRQCNNKSAPANLLFMFMLRALSLLWLQRRIILVMSDMVTVNTSIFNQHVVKHNMFVCCLAWGGQTNVGDIVWSDNTATNEAFIMVPSRL